MAQSELNELTGNNGPSEPDLRRTLNTHRSPHSPDCFEFMDLPTEIRGLIYQQIPQTQVGRLRMVCKQLRAEIDDLYTFEGIINENKPGWERIFGRRLRTCVIRRFVTNQQPELVFKYPNLVKSLFLSSSSKASVGNFDRLLLQCAKNLKYLHVDFAFRDGSYNSLFVANFSTLSTLSFSWDNGYNRMELKQFFSNATLNSLRKLQLRITLSSEVSKCTCHILSLLVRNWRTLETIDISLSYDGHILSLQDKPTFELLLADLKFVDFTMLGKFVQLKKFILIGNISVDAVNGFTSKIDIPSSSNTITMWSDFVQLQSKLVNCTSIFPLRWPILPSIVSKNFSSLETLHLDCLTTNGTTYRMNNDGEFDLFDLTLFQQCLKLKYLTLELMKLTDRLLKIHLTNLLNLPTSLVSLALRHFRVLPDDLYEFLTSQSHEANLVSITNHYDKFNSLIEKCQSQKLGFVDLTVAFIDFVWERHEAGVHAE